MVKQSRLLGLPRPIEMGGELIRLTERQLHPIKPGEALRLISWNIQKFYNQQSFKDLQTLNLNTEFLLLQEALTGSAYHPFYSEMGLVEWWAARNVGYNQGVFAGLTTGAKHAVGSVQALRSPFNEPILRTPKTSLVSIHPVAESAPPLMLVNLHGVNFVSFKAYRMQIQQIHEVVKKHEGPLIIAGDFNTHLSNRRFLISSFADSLKMKIVDFKEDRRFLKLDQVLIRGFKLKEAHIYDHIRSSDHAPVYVELLHEP